MHNHITTLTTYIHPLCSTPTIEILKYILSTLIMYRRQCVKVFGVKSNEFLVMSGVSRSKHLSSILFSPFINDTFHVLRDSMLLCFVDIKLLLKIKSLDNYMKFYRDMNRFDEWFRLIGLSLNIENVNIRLTRSR